MREGDSDDFWRFGCRQMAGLKSSTQSDMARHQKPLSVVVSESLSLEGPYLATNFQGVARETVLRFSIARLSHGFSSANKRKRVVFNCYKQTPLPHPLFCCFVCLVYKWLKHAANYLLLHVQHTHTPTQKSCCNCRKPTLYCFAVVATLTLQKTVARFMF